MSDWERNNGAVWNKIEEQARAVLQAYEADPSLVEEHAGQEQEARTGGYGRRQVFELVQNAADQLESGAGRIQVVRTEKALYCANAGKPFTPQGVESILHAYLSRKTDDQIGRFGLGFKSVLGVSAEPLVLTRSGSFRFGPDVADKIREVAENATAVPLLRIAERVDASACFAKDQVAAELADWAATIIVLPFGDDEAAWLEKDLRKFPKEFLAFADHVEALVLEDRVNDVTREITAERRADFVVLREGDDEERVLIFEGHVRLDKAATKRAGKLANQKAARIKWAVSPKGGRDLGSFWSYFPTDDETTLRGVLNAPWQLSEDRRRLVDGPYNTALLKGAVEVVISNLDTLRRHQDDPAAYLEILPGRGKEPRCWADEILTDEANDALSYRESIPLLSGELEITARARLHPAGLPNPAFALWQSVADPGEWVHHAVDRQKDRRARIERYMSKNRSSGEATLAEWMEPVLSEPTPERGIAAARIAGTLRKSEFDPDIGDIAFVLTEDLKWVRPDTPNLVLPGEYEPHDPDTLLVHPEVAADADAARALEAFGLERISVEVELRRLIAHDQPSTDREWEEFWAIVRQMPSALAHSIMKEAKFAPKVRTLDGTFRSCRVALLPGRCVPADGSRDGAYAIDAKWHAHELDVLQLLGCADGPRPHRRASDEPWYEEYVAEARELFLERNKPARVSKDLLEIDPASQVPGPLAPLRALSPEGKAALVKVALDAADGLASWTVRHSTQQTRYQAVQVPNPAVWLILKEGLLETPVGPRRPSECVGPELRAGNLAPAPTLSTAAARALRLPERWSQVRKGLLEEILELALAADPDEAGVLYASLVEDEDLVPPEVIRCVRNGLPAVAERGAIAVVVGDDERELLSSGTEPLIDARDEETRERFVKRWEMVDARTLISRRVAPLPQSDPVLLIDEFPPLKKLLGPRDRMLELQRCEEIRVIEEVVGGTRSTDVRFAAEENRLYCHAEMSDRALLAEISRELGLGLSSENIDSIIRGVRDYKTKALVREARNAASDAERLLILLGADALRARLPRAVVSAYIDIHGEPTDLQLAELALSVHGVDVLKVHQEDFEERNLTPPSTWAGSRKAKEFVRSLGFRPELAGFESDKRPPELVVEGRPKMPDLHDYQEKLVEEMQKLFVDPKANRAMLTLPTGAGKTRVAIEGAIRGILDGLFENNLILWIAQSDELCEQAVQAWSQLWRASDLEERLTISRLWSSNSAEPASSGVQVVVATIHKLQTVIDVAAYDWLREPGLVVIDEAHSSISPMYTKALTWLGLERRKYSRPLLGLSATPYKGRSEEETVRLVRRYGERRLDVNVFGPGDHYAELQEMGVISRVEHRTLEGGSITLKPEDYDKILRTGLLPKAADTKLGEDVDRTRRVVESILELPDDWPVLVFAPSIENAQALAGLLNHAGVSAAAISGETPTAARSWYVREFREGRLRVITNYQVLAEGFDAPSVRAVYVARPVFAPNRYQQMVGRGLRGRRNGGKEECLIVDVEDNIENFNHELAFFQFEYLWSPEAVGVR